MFGRDLVTPRVVEQNAIERDGRTPIIVDTAYKDLDICVTPPALPLIAILSSPVPNKAFCVRGSFRGRRIAGEIGAS